MFNFPCAYLCLVAHLFWADRILTLFRHSLTLSPPLSPSATYFEPAPSFYGEQPAHTIVAVTMSAIPKLKRKHDDAEQYDAKRSK